MFMYMYMKMSMYMCMLMYMYMHMNMYMYMSMYMYSVYWSSLAACTPGTSGQPLVEGLPRGSGGHVRPRRI